MENESERITVTTVSQTPAGNYLIKDGKAAGTTLTPAEFMQLKRLSGTSRIFIEIVNPQHNAENRET
jgi:hypothetical protein